MVENPISPKANPTSYRLLILGLIICGLIGNLVLYGIFNMVSVVGGPVALTGTIVFTLLLGGLLWVIPVKTFGGRLGSVLVASALWAVGSVFLLIALDPVQAWLWKVDTERVAKEYAGGALPPRCEIKGTYRGSVHTPLECKDSVAVVAAWYRSRLGTDWVESREDQDIHFTRQVPGKPKQKISVYRDHFFVKGTAVVVSPTQTNQ